MNSFRVSPNQTTPWAKFLRLKNSLSLLLVGVVFATGCTIDKLPVKNQGALLKQPVVDVRLSSDDFGFPSHPPSLKEGKEVFQKNCMACHAPSFWQQPRVQKDLRYVTPIDFYLMLSRGTAPKVTHPSAERPQVLPTVHEDPVNHQPLVFKEKLSRDERWAVIFYARHLAGNDDISYTTLDGQPIEVSALFGGNCAVCHGNRGFADGFLHTGRPSKHGVEGGKVHIGLFEPPPANFHDYKRFYNRTDAQLFKYISEGVYPSAMPPWAGRVDKDKNIVFDEKLRWNLVRYVRQFSFNANDLPDTDTIPAGPIPTGEVSVLKIQSSSGMDATLQSESNPSTTSKAGEAHP
jgi:mono/diheme cytochrome c family protein